MNTELFQKIHNAITTQPDQHDQSTWESQSVHDCDTTRCVAGWAIHLTTGQPVLSWQPGEEIRLSDATIDLAHDKGVYVEDPEDSAAILDLAFKLLGLEDFMQAHLLFYVATDERARRAVEKAAAGDRDGFLLTLNGGGQDAER